MDPLSGAAISGTVAVRRAFRCHPRSFRSAAGSTGAAILSGVQGGHISAANPARSRQFALYVHREPVRLLLSGYRGRQRPTSIPILRVVLSWPNSIADPV